MAGGRQLLRKVLRHNRAPFCQPHVSCAITGLSKAIDGHEISFSNEQHVVHLSKVDNDEDRSVTTPDILSRVSKITGQCLRSQFVPSSSQRDREYTFHVDTLHSLANVGSVAFGVLSHPRGGGTFRCSHPSVYSSFNTSRHCSSASGQRLEAELGDVAAMHGNSGGFDTITADIAANLATPEARAVNDVSAIIGDCSYPTAALQLCIDFMHSHLDIPWWGAIIATTIALRIFLLPLVIYQMKSTAKLTLMRPEMEKLNEKVKNSNFDPVASSQARVEMLNLFKKYNTNPISPFIGGLLQAPIFICFFFAIKNMCERLEDFKVGGFFWFTDLTAVDSTYILPTVLCGTMLLTVELHALDGMDGNPYGDKMKNFMRIFSVVLFPVSLSFEKALFFYWIPSNMFALFQSIILKQKAVKEALGIPSTAHLTVSTSTDATSFRNTTSTLTDSTVNTPVLEADRSMKGPIRRKKPSERNRSRSSKRR